MPQITQQAEQEASDQPSFDNDYSTAWVSFPGDLGLTLWGILVRVWKFQDIFNDAACSKKNNQSRQNSDLDKVTESFSDTLMSIRDGKAKTLWTKGCIDKMGDNKALKTWHHLYGGSSREVDKVSAWSGKP
ncbi:hypothetical protein EAF00_000314 [Botryotinia globosa]|nr:hypothetical protein EAF00_000314 [Botryotinia globosa]